MQSNRQLYAVFDANNFYVSCERVVNPKLNGIPVVVANPGGIVLARSNEAKALGIGMAEPLFKIEDKLREFNIRVATTRFALYTDLSRRIATILHELFPLVEDYSIDESFVHFQPSQSIPDIEKLCVKARRRILEWVGVPVSVGIASTKTLAKVAIKFAKKTEAGVKVISTEEERINALEKFPIQDIWGIGRALGKKLPAYNINTAAQLAAQDPLEFRKKFSVMLAYTINELNGIPCFSVDTSPKPAKSLMCTESYHEEVVEAEQLEKRLKALATRAGRQLRKQHEVAGGMGIFVRGNRFHKERGYLALQEYTTFLSPTSNTPTFTRFVDDAMAKLFPYGARVKRAGVFMIDLIPENDRQVGLFESATEEIREKDSRAMKAVDAIEKKWGKKPQPFLTVNI